MYIGDIKYGRFVQVETLEQIAKRSGWALE